MKTIATIIAIAALSASAAVSAHEGASITRVQVVAERNAAAGNAPYGELYAGTQFDTISTRTREQVKAEVLIARQRGELVHGEQYPPQVVDSGEPGKTRAEVRAELAAFRLANPDSYAEIN